jgi:hypothetical protein
MQVVLAPSASAMTQKRRVSHSDSTGIARGSLVSALREELKEASMIELEENRDQRLREVSVEASTDIPRRQPRDVIVELSYLRPLILDSSSIQESIRELIDGLEELTPAFLKMRELEQSLLLRMIVLTSLKAEVSDFRLWLEKSAAAVYDHFLQSSPTLSTASHEFERRLLEGYRILLRRADCLLSRIHYFSEHPKEREESLSCSKSRANSRSSDGAEKEAHRSDEDDSAVESRLIKRFLAKKVRV